MIRLLGSLIGLLFLAVLALGVLLLTLLDDEPLVERPETLSPAAIEQARDLLRTNDPRRLRPGEQHAVEIPAGLVDEGLNYLASRYLRARGALARVDGAAEIRVSFPVPAEPVPRYLNLRIAVPPAGGAPRDPALAIGDVPVPPALLEQAVALLARFGGLAPEWQLPRETLCSLAFDPAQNALLLAYTWNPELLERARAVAFAPRDIARIEAAQTTLAAALQQLRAGKQHSLAAVLGPLLGGAGQDAGQRRAGLLALAAYMSGKGLSPIIPDAASWPRPPRVQLTLGGRHDSAQHFAVSAALAAWAGEPAAAAIGIFKEIDDSRGGSGFSFADLAADQAGTRFGERVMAGSDPLARVLARGVTDAELLPPLKGLPENLQEDEFRRRFGGPGEPAYRAMEAEIARRLAAMPLYR